MDYKLICFIMIVEAFIFLIIIVQVLDKYQGENKTLKSKLKSEEVKRGKIVENLVVFDEKKMGYKEGESHKDLIFIGNPFDFIGFHDTRLMFYEIKSGESKLNQNQRKHKKNLGERRIGFREVRCDSNE